MWKKKIMTLLVSAGVLLAVPGAAFAATDPSPEQVKPTARQTTEVSQTSPKTGDFTMAQAGVTVAVLLGAGTVVFGLRQRKVR